MTLGRSHLPAVSAAGEDGRLDHPALVDEDEFPNGTICPPATNPTLTLLAEWIDGKIKVNGYKAQLHVKGTAQSTRIVNDVKEDHARIGEPT